MKVITRDKALALVKDGAVLVDLRSPIEFRDYKIEGAINLPLRNFSARMMGEKNKSAKYIIFSNSVKDKDVELALRFAAEFGVKNVFVSDYFRLREPSTQDIRNVAKHSNRPKPDRKNVTVTVKKTRKGA
jgi:rhodanese-related sulfurtransferase